jgi:isopenicillin N synthase-like dioxygenase
MPSDAIPVIDLAGPRAQVVAAIGAACESVGFFYVVGHGHPTGLLERVYTMSEALFALPEADKRAIDMANSPFRRGYESIASQTLDLAARPDQKESFYCGPDYPPDHEYTRKGYSGYGPSQWPPIAGFAPAMLEYIALHDKLCRRILSLMAEHLGLAADFFEPMHDDPMITLRLLRYPPHPQAAPDDLFGAGAHTDWGGVTTLAQDAIGGLQVKMPDGSWLDATPVPGSYVVNLGDLMPRWSNGRFKSNLHRVVNRAHDRARYSIPFFYGPNYEARIDALPGCTGPGAPWKYTSCSAGEHLHEMFMLTYGQAKAA